MKANENVEKEVTAMGNWVIGAWGPMSYKRNGLKQCEGAEVKNFVKVVWRHEAVSMVLFSKWIYCIYYAYRGVIDFKIVVEELTMLWIISCSVFVVVVMQKRAKESENGWREKK